MDITDMQLMHFTRAGDDEAFRALMERYQDRVKTLFWHALGRRDNIAEDLAQRTFIGLYQCALRGKTEESEDGSLEALIIGIARRIGIDHYRREDVQATLRADMAVLGIQEAQPSDAAHQKRETQRVVREAIARLPPDDRRAVELHYFEELSCAEAARRTGTSASTMKRRIAGAGKRLRRWLEPYWRGVRNGRL